MSKSESINEIKLTQGQVAIVDSEVFKSINQFKWYAITIKNRNNYGFYAVRDIREGKLKRRQYMHKLILGIDGTDTIGDHKNGNKLDNRCDNLRVATESQNSQNKNKQIDNTSGFKGVYWNKRDKKFQAYIRTNGKGLSLGYFDDPIMAAKAYDTKAKELFGDFARCNFSEVC